MSENMYSPGQKTYTKEGMDNFDRIFNSKGSGKRKSCKKDPKKPCKCDKK